MKLIAEIGQNHNGSIAIAMEMISAAKACGVDYVKFAKRHVESCVPSAMWDIPRETPWGIIPYIEYRRKLEFGQDEYEQIDDYCRSQGVSWFASASDVKSVEFLSQFDIPIIKIPSAKNDDLNLIRSARGAKGWRVMASLGMCDELGVALIAREIRDANPVMLHCVASYPAANDAINLASIRWLIDKYPGIEIGYSGHEIGIQVSLAAVALGATWVERHFTLSRTMWGSDQAASVEPKGMMLLRRDAAVIEAAMGDYGKFVQPCEADAMKRLRG